MGGLTLDATIFAALIGAFSGIVVGLVGNLFTVWIASKQIKAERQRRWHEEKAKAYSGFLSEYHTFLLTAQKGKFQYPEGVSEEEMVESMRFSAAYSSAALFASKELRKKLSLLYDLAIASADKEKVHPDLLKTYWSLLEDLHEDLAEL